MSRLSKTEIYAIKWLASEGEDAGSISKQLKIPEDKIISVLEKNQPMNKEKIRSGSEPSKNKQKTLMINETAVKKNKSVSIMTEGASQRNDEVIKNMVSKKEHTAIFRPNNGK
jgi:hypothetical protein